MELGEDIMIGHPFFTSYKLRWKRHIVSKVTVELVHFHYPQKHLSMPPVWQNKSENIYESII